MVKLLSGNSPLSTGRTGAYDSGSIRSYSDTSGGKPAQGHSRQRTQSQEPERKLPLTASEVLDAATPEAAAGDNLCLDFATAEPTNAFNR